MSASTSSRADKRGRSFDVPCIVRVSHRFEELSAHVELEGDVAIGPGDEVLVHGAPINPPYGQIQIERRHATVTRAHFWRRAWTRLTGQLECLSLIDVSFSDRRSL